MLSPILGLASITFWIGSVFIDADHYLEFIYHNRLTDFSIRRMLNYHHILGGWLARKEFINLSVFHTAEFLLLSYLGALWSGSPMLKAALWGMLFHVLLDTLNLSRRGFVTKRAYSITDFFIQKKRMERNGLHPKVLYKEALDLTWRDAGE